MGHPEIDNRTPFAFAPLFATDEDGQPIVATIVKATFDVSAQGLVTLAEEQRAVDFVGEHHGEPGESSYRLEPDTAFVKPATDCVLLGHAVATVPTTQLSVTFRVGPVGKMALVTGDRFFEHDGLGVRISAPSRFQMLPLVYERAFGGWDRTSADKAHHEGDPRNPVGVGFVAKHGTFVPGSPVPNVEDPGEPLGSHGGRCPAVGFGFIGPEWYPRTRFIGTYDDVWAKTRSPLLPRDFDRRFFQAASDGLTSPGYLLGNEPVEVTGATAEGRWVFRLPGIQPPHCTVATRLVGDRPLATNLDTVIVDADARQVILVWRAFTALPSGPHDIRGLVVTCPNAPSSPVPAPVGQSSTY